ncbi:MAG: AAA family ATPase, partial [Pseudomonadota bacterium]
MPQFSPDQDNALKAVSQWLASKPGQLTPQGSPPQIFRLFGYAGTGKTMLAKHIAEGIDGTVKFAAFTGKAALVMRNRGCTGAQTIHSLIYRAQDTKTETPQFQIWDNAPVGKAKLIIVDEASMVDKALGNDLLSFGVPLLVLGDPAQLPPVSGGGYFTEAEPDVMLTEVHRQAQDDPIVKLSMAVRAGEALQPGNYGETEVVRKREFDGDRVLSADQVLVGRNATRRKYNERYRERLEIEEMLPIAGDRLVCLR